MRSTRVEKTLADERQSLEAIIDRLRDELALQSKVASEAAAKQREEIAEIYAKYNATEAKLTRQAIEMKKACDEVKLACSYS